MSAAPESNKPGSAKNTRTALMTFGIFVGMLGLAYASVPLYRLFCQVTGFGGTPMRAEEMSRTVLDKTIRVRFDSNTDNALPWRFSPVLRQQTVKIGANTLAFYESENMSDKPITGMATFNVTPDIAAPYFTKVQCFCFNEQTLQPGEKVNMPVSYYVDPKIMDDPQARNIPEITLSYTFYRVEEPETSTTQTVSAVPPVAPAAIR
jgi:cytochrome c oxidase assembly protein subunit 11